jgi:molybdopterin converting factor small subunit
MATNEFKITLFGLLAEEAGTNTVVCTSLPNTEALLASLFLRYPLWQSMRLLLAVNHHIVLETTSINTTDEIALMPPFSGG